MNNGVSAEATSVATKHRDPNENLLMQAALKIGKIIIKNNNRFNIIEVETLLTPLLLPKLSLIDLSAFFLT
jgi:hypothetical protein